MLGDSFYAVLHYAGQGFAGWQSQPHTRTVQSEVEGALARLAGHRVVCHAAGRTDAGVHALGQVVSFTMPRAWAPDDLLRALRAVTPDDLWVARVGVAFPGFHARRDARSRRYRYVVGCDAAAFSPFRRPFEWALGLPLDGDALAAAATAIRGEHDFRAYAAVGQDKPHYRCDVSRAEWAARPDAHGFIFTIEADRFLHHMVRFLVGTMVDAARGRRPLEDVARLLTITENRETSPPAPPQGLYLVHVSYPQLEEASAR
ncbi:MAG: tRNA pseudouridine(38-40) synthase TruA [Gemmatimonadales bacterium]|nr:tRNA pseudouridine(38-40) synthase TruA [Gemmatimonadales bacterium]